VAAGAKAYAVFVIFVLVFGAMDPRPARTVSAIGGAMARRTIIREKLKENRRFFYAKAPKSQRSGAVRAGRQAEGQMNMQFSGVSAAATYASIRSVGSSADKGGQTHA
jgi:hypothetical protein